MGSVTVKTKEMVNDMFYETEYIFEESVDFFCWKEMENESMMNMADMFEDPLGEQQPVQIKVAKKTTKH